MQIRLSLGAATLLLAAVCAAPPASAQTGVDQKTAADQKAALEKAEKKKADRKASADVKKKFSKTLQGGEMKSGVYQMSQDELAMDCKRMTGSMRITITRLRDAETRKGASSMAEQAHKTVPSLFGGSTAGADRQASLARDRAKLDAYNRQLAARNCKTLDVEAELARAPDPPKKY